MKIQVKPRTYFFDEKGIDWVNGEPIKRDGPTETICYEPGAPLRLELEHFINCINGDDSNTLISGERGVDILRVLEEAESSLHDQSSPIEQTHTQNNLIFCTPYGYH